MLYDAIFGHRHGDVLASLCRAADGMRRRCWPVLGVLGGAFVAVDLSGLGLTVAVAVALLLYGLCVRERARPVGNRTLGGQDEEGVDLEALGHLLVIREMPYMWMQHSGVKRVLAMQHATYKRMFVDSCC